MDRHGVAATIASVVIFTTLILANSVLFSVENSYLGSRDQTSAEVQERGVATLLTGVSAYSSLSSAQSFIETNVMSCSSPGSYLASLTGNTALTGDEGSVAYSESSGWTYVAGSAPQPGDHLLPSQFDGYDSDGLNIQVETDINETFAGGLPTYSGHTMEVVHIPVQPYSIASECLTVLGTLRSELSNATSCDPSSFAGPVAEVDASFVRTNLDLQAGASVVSTSNGTCQVDYWVRMTQSGIQGVSAAFQLRAFGSGSLSE
jgi:hypothetical protein